MEIGLRRAQINALKASLPDLEPDLGPPRGSVELGEGYILLRAKDKAFHRIRDCETPIFHRFLCTVGYQLPFTEWIPKVTRWARLRLPNGQIARSVWKEDTIILGNLRKFRMVKLRFPDSSVQFAEVKFYFMIKINDVVKAYALVVYFSDLDRELTVQTFNTLLVCRPLEDTGLDIISVNTIQAVVGMLPLLLTLEEEAKENSSPGRYTGLFFVAEKPGLEVFHLSGGDEEDNDTFHDSE
ncbi:hypothetical protein ABKN59_011504 [Abortiporus biennis]